MDHRVLVVDDDRLIRELTRDALAQEGFRVICASSGPEALERSEREGPFDVVITDLSMREMDGLVLLVRVKRASPRSRRDNRCGSVSAQSLRTLSTFSGAKAQIALPGSSSAPAPSSTATDPQGSPTQKASITPERMASGISGGGITSMRTAVSGSMPEAASQ